MEAHAELLSLNIFLTASISEPESSSESELSLLLVDPLSLDYIP